MLSEAHAFSTTALEIPKNREILVKSLQFTKSNLASDSSQGKLLSLRHFLLLHGSVSKNNWYIQQTALKLLVCEAIQVPTVRLCTMCLEKVTDVKN